MVKSIIATSCSSKTHPTKGKPYMKIYYDFDDLPDAIRSSASTAKLLKGKLLFLFQTTFKPSQSASYAWFLMYSDGIMLRTASQENIFKEILVADIKCIRLRDYGSDRNLLEITFNGLNTDNDYITIPKELDAFKLEDHFKSSGISVANSIKS